MIQRINPEFQLDFAVHINIFAIYCLGCGGLLHLNIKQI